MRNLNTTYVLYTNNYSYSIATSSEIACDVAPSQHDFLVL